MSEKAEADVDHVTSTNTNGKYLNPDLYKGIIEELYSNRSPLDLLHETCDKIGRDSNDWKKKTGAIEVSARNQNREAEKRVALGRRSNQRSDIGEDNNNNSRDDVIVVDWCTASLGCRAKSAPNADDDEESADDQPQDLRCWFRERPPSGATSAGCQATAAAAAPPGESTTHRLQSSAIEDEPHLFSSSYSSSSSSSSRSIGQRKYQGGPRVNNAPLRPWPYARESGTKYPSPPHAFLPSPLYDADVLFTQYLELQYLAQASVLREYLSSLQQLAFAKASAAVVLRANCPLSSGGGGGGGGGGGMTDEVKLVQSLPEALANGVFLSPPPPPHPQLRCEGTLGFGGGGFVPLGIPYFGGGGGGGGGGCGHYQLPVFDHRLFVVEEEEEEEEMKQRRRHPHPHLMRAKYEGLLNGHQQRVLLEKRFHHLQGSVYEPDPLLPTSPDTSTDQPSPSHLTSPKSQRSWIRRRRSDRTWRAEENQGRRHPHSRVTPSSDEILRRSLATCDHVSRSFDPTLFPSKKL